MFSGLMSLQVETVRNQADEPQQPRRSFSHTSIVGIKVHELEPSWELRWVTSLVEIKVLELKPSRE